MYIFITKALIKYTDMSAYFGLDKIKRFLTFEDIPTEWTFQDYSKGHFVMLHILLSVTFIFQLTCFILAAGLYNFSQLELSVSIIEDPYFDCLNWGVIIFLSFFQSLALVKSPYYITPYISKKLKYSNLAISILCSLFTITKSITQQHFLSIFNTILSVICFILAINAYKIAHNQQKKLNLNKKIEFLGFSVMYSLLMPLMLIEFITSLAFSIKVIGYGLASDHIKVIIFVFCIFIIGFVVLLWKQEFYMSGTIIFHILGVYSVQKREVCEYYREHCSEKVQIVCLVLAVGLGVCLGMMMIFERDKKKIMMKKEVVGFANKWES